MLLFEVPKTEEPPAAVATEILASVQEALTSPSLLVQEQEALRRFGTFLRHFGASAPQIGARARDVVVIATIMMVPPAG
jgi:tRNA A37 threonylcarbamoyladenosine synthetase subunit TsaC/SUA5/YrdC